MSPLPFSSPISSMEDGPEPICPRSITSSSSSAYRQNKEEKEEKEEEAKEAKEATQKGEECVCVLCECVVMMNQEDMPQRGVPR